MLQVKTKEQEKKVLEILGTQETFCHFPLDLDKETDWGYEEFSDRIYLDGNITFDTLKMDDFTKSMSDVYTTSVCQETIDESPMAYKPMQEIIDAVGDTVEILDVIKPIYNFKAKGR